MHDSWAGVCPSDAMVCYPDLWLHQRRQEEMASSTAVDLYAFSWSVPRRPAGNVVKTAQWKSQLSAALRLQAL
jgi:hypothetical protein